MQWQLFMKVLMIRSRTHGMKCKIKGNNLDQELHMPKYVWNTQLSVWYRELTILEKKLNGRKSDNDTSINHNHKMMGISSWPDKLGPILSQSINLFFIKKVVTKSSSPTVMETEGWWNWQLVLPRDLDFSEPHNHWFEMSKSELELTCWETHTNL